MYFVSCIMCHFSPPWLILTRWMRQVCPKRRYTFTAPHLVISRKTFNLKVSTIVALCCRREPVFLNFDTSCPCAFRRHSLNISTRLTWVTPNYSPLPPTHTHTSPLLCPLGKSTWYPLNRKLGGPQNRNKRYEKRKIAAAGKRTSIFHHNVSVLLQSNGGGGTIVQSL